MVRKQPKLKTESDAQVFSRLAWLISLGVIHVLACYFLPLFLDLAQWGNPVAVVACFAVLGIIASQFVILGFLLALFPADLMVRLSLVIGLVALSIGITLIASPFGGQPGGPIQDLAEEYLCRVPILLAGWSIPFFAAKALFGWRLSFEVDQSVEQPRLTVASLLLGTALIAVCLMLLKTGSTPHAAPAIAASIACMGCGFVIAIPSALIMLGGEHTGWRLVKALSISTGPAAILLGAWAASGTSDWRPLYGAVAMSCMLMSYCVFLIGVRGAGLRLSTTRQASNLNGVDDVRRSS